MIWRESKRTQACIGRIWKEKKEKGTSEERTKRDGRNGGEEPGEKWESMIGWKWEENMLKKEEREGEHVCACVCVCVPKYQDVMS